MVHHDGAHAHQHLVVDGAAVHDGVVPDASFRRWTAPPARCSAARPVLHVHPVPDADAVHITTHHRVVPHAAIVAHHHITDHHGGLRQEGVPSERGWSPFQVRTSAMFSGPWAVRNLLLAACGQVGEGLRIGSGPHRSPSLVTAWRTLSGSVLRASYCTWMMPVSRSRSTDFTPFS